MLPDLLQALGSARDLGLLGPGPLEDQLAHSQAFAALLDPPAGPFLDLGSGGGLPGLVLARAWPDASGVLLDAQQRRAAFLTRVVIELALDDPLRVAPRRAGIPTKRPLWA